MSLLSVDHALKAGDAEATGGSVFGLGAMIAFGATGRSLQRNNHRRSSRNEGEHLNEVTLHPGEVEIDTWTLLYVPPGGGKYNGKLTVTNRRLLYDAKFDVSVKGMLAEALTIKWGSEGYLEIDKSSIQAVEVQKKLLSKKCILTLTDGSKHTFDYGAMNIDKTVAAIEAR